MDNIPNILVEYGLAKDIHWAKELIRSGCIALDGKIIRDEDIKVPIGGKISKVGCIIKVGKRRWLQVMFDNV